MPDIHNPDPGSGNKRPFMREKIAKPPRTRGQMIRRMLVFLFAAVLLGVAAGVSFAVARPLAEHYLVPETPQETTPITIPKDEPETTPEATEPEMTESSEETEPTEPIEDILQNAMEGYQYNITDLTTLHGNLRIVAQEAEKGVVEVHSVRQEMDWFDNPVERTGVYAGIILSITPQEILVLTPVKAVENADSIKVTFNNSGDISGAIKQIDHIIGMAIVSVDHTQLDETVLNSISEVELGNSYSVKQGDLVIAIGGPVGLVHSSTYGEVSYILKNYSRTDGSSRLFYTDIKSDPDIGTFLLNTDGQVIGWMSSIYRDELESQLPIAVAISEYKGILEKLSNGIPAPYMGIRGQEISPEVADTGVPIGVFVADAVVDGPAYNAGIQNGDIITKIGEQEITSVKDLQTAVELLTSGEEVNVVIQRNGIEEYIESEYHVTIGTR